MAMFGNRSNALPKGTVDDLLRKVPIGGNPVQQFSAAQAPQPYAMNMAPVTNPEASYASEKMPVWKAALGGLFDSIQQQTGGQATFIPNLLRQQDQRRQQQLSDMLYQRKREDDWTDFQRERSANYEDQLGLIAAKSNSREPTELEQKVDYYNRIGRPDLARAIQENTADPIVNIPLPGGRVYMGPRSGLADIPKGGDPTSNGVPLRPVGKLTPFGGR